VGLWRCHKPTDTTSAVLGKILSKEEQEQCNFIFRILKELLYYDR
jgi:hypothetical protein